MPYTAYRLLVYLMPRQVRQMLTHLARDDRQPTDPVVARQIRQPSPRPAADNPARGHRRIHAQPAGSGYQVAAATVWTILHAHRSPTGPPPRRNAAPSSIG